MLGCLGLKGSSWRQLGPSSGGLEAVRRFLEVFLEACWALLGPTWGLVGPSWGALGAFLCHLGSRWGSRGRSWGHVAPRWGHLVPSRSFGRPTWAHHGLI